MVDPLLLLLLVLDAPLLRLTQLVGDVQLKILLLEPHDQFDVLHRLDIHLSFLLHEPDLLGPLVSGVHDLVLEAHALRDLSSILQLINPRFILLLSIPYLLHLLLPVSHNLSPDNLCLLLAVPLLLNYFGG